jgi:hypothetical protein
MVPFIVVIAISPLTISYPKWTWAGVSGEINLFRDVYKPAMTAINIFFLIPVAFISIIPVASSFIRHEKVRYIIEAIWYLFSIAFLWFGFWVTGFYTNCIALSRASDGSPLGGGPCGSLITFSRSPNTFISHVILWVVWSAILLWTWIIMKRKILSPHSI